MSDLAMVGGGMAEEGNIPSHVMGSGGITPETFLIIDMLVREF